MPILIPPSTPNDASPYAIVPKVINASWDYGLEKAAEYATNIETARSEIDALLSNPSVNHVAATPVTGAAVVEPVVAIPQTAEVANVYDEYKTQYLELVQMLSGEFVDFRATFYPDENNVYTAAEDSLQAAMASGNYLPATVSSQILGDAYALITADKQKAQDAVINMYAGRGFPLPAIVASAAVVQIEQKAQDQIAETARKIAILTVEQYRFVIEKVLALRATAMASAVDYIKALASGPDMASKLIGVGYDAQSKLISATSQYYNARIAAAELTNKVAQFNTTSELDAAVKNQAADLTLIEDKMKALLAQAQALAQMAASLFNNVHVSSGVSASSSNSVGYSYSNDTQSAAPTVTSA